MSLRNSLEIEKVINELNASKLNTLLKNAKLESQRIVIQKSLENKIGSLKPNDDVLQLISIIEIIQIARKNSIPLDLSSIANENLATVIKEILLLKPSDAEWLLFNMKQIPKIDFLFDSMDYATVRKNLFNSVESRSLLQCLSKITLFIDDNTDLFKKLINDYLQVNSEHAVTLALFHYKTLVNDGAAYTNQKISLKELFQLIINSDSPHALVAFLDLIKINHETFSEEAEDKHLNSESMLTAAITARASQSVTVLLENFSFSSEVIIRAIKKAIENYDILIVLALSGNNLNNAAQHIFTDKLFIEEARDQLDNFLLTLLRFSQIEVLDNIINMYANEKNKAVLRESYQHAKSQFMQYSPSYSRYTKLSDLNGVDKRYNRNIPQNYEDKAIKDNAYGKNRSEFVTSLVTKIQGATPEKPFIPNNEILRNLPSSKNGAKIFAALLENFAEYSYSNNPNVKKRQEFSTLNQMRGTVTPLYGYTWGTQIADIVFHYSKANEIIKYPHLSEIKEAGYAGGALYSLTYNGKIISNVSHIPDFLGIASGHGRLPLDDTIGDIEDLIEKMSVPLKKNKDATATIQEAKEYENELTQFYQDAARLAWLIGNTTPMLRGSGSIAELTLKAIFEIQGLQAPTLKTEFPQLDVLDILIPLDDYIKLFPYFFEPSSLPKHLRKPCLTPLSAGEQLKHYYNEINGITFIPRALEEKNFFVSSQSCLQSNTMFVKPNNGYQEALKMNKTELADQPNLTAETNVI